VQESGCCPCPYFGVWRSEHAWAVPLHRWHATSIGVSSNDERAFPITPDHHQVIICSSCYDFK
jgi:hypothetical protein